jgi:CDP-diacylglycerol--serine O-phosphatidyltransferase
VSFELDLDVIKQPYLISGWLVFIGLMMVSSIPTFSFKGSKLPRKLVIPLFVIAGLFIACVLTETWIALAMLIMAYFFSIPLSFLSYRKLNLREQIGALEE